MRQEVIKEDEQVKIKGLFLRAVEVVAGVGSKPVAPLMSKMPLVAPVPWSMYPMPTQSKSHP